MSYRINVTACNAPTETLTKKMKVWYKIMSECIKKYSKSSGKKIAIDFCHKSFLLLL